jgi:mannose-6-phosphate isomerase-like protein (cupin superfamily)
VPEKVDLAAALGTFDEAFRPRIVADYNGNKVQVAKVRGKFVWHAHSDTDDFFLVLDGKLAIDLEDGQVELGPGELFVVPRGMRHRPRAEGECHILLIERRRTPNTGDAEHVEPAPEVEI